MLRTCVAVRFRLFDQDGDGLITTDQFRAVMEKLGEPLTAEEVLALGGLTGL